MGYSTDTVVSLMALGLVLVVTAGCGAEYSDLMIPFQPPPRWTEDLGAYRTVRDQGFVNSPESPLLPEDKLAFEGLAYFDPDPGYYFVGPLHRYPEPQKLDILTTTGKVRPGEKYGWIGFTLEGSVQTLQVYRMLDQPDGGPTSYLVAFADGTSGKETYPAGRYVSLQGSEGGPYILDFNLAHNPFCAYGAPERFACPRAPADNRLSVRIEAGERGYKLPPDGK